MLVVFAVSARWFLFVLPQRKVAAILAKPPSFDRQIPQFRDVEGNWNTFRVLPAEGLKTIWKIQLSDGSPIGTMEVGGFHKGPKKGSHPLEIRGKEFWIRKNVPGFVQTGFRIFSPELELKLLRDEEFGFIHSFKNGFKNLKMIHGNDVITVQGEKNERIVLRKNGTRIGVATHRIGAMPGFAAMAPDVTELDQVVLFYCMLLNG